MVALQLRPPSHESGLKDSPSLSPAFHNFKIAFVARALLLGKGKPLAPIVIAQEHLANTPPGRCLVGGLIFEACFIRDSIWIAALEPPTHKHCNLVAIMLRCLGWHRVQ